MRYETPILTLKPAQDAPTYEHHGIPYLCAEFVSEYFEQAPNRISLVASTTRYAGALRVVIVKCTDMYWKAPGNLEIDAFFPQLQVAARKFSEAGHTVIYVTIYDETGTG